MHDQNDRHDTRTLVIQLAGQLTAIEKLFNKDLAYIKDAVDGTNDRLDVLNGRQRKTEADVAVLQALQTAAGDPDTGTVARKRGRVAGTLIGVLTGGWAIWRTLVK